MSSLQGDCVVLVRNLNPQTTEEALKTHLSTVGEVTRVLLGKDSLTGEPTGNAHCAFTTRDKASQAISRLNGRDLDGNELEILEIP